MLRTVGNWYWVLWISIGFGVPEIAGLVTNDRFPTLSHSWKQARDTWPVWASIALSVATMAVGLWLLTVHWSFSVLDRRGVADDLLVAFVGGLLGALSWKATRGKARTRPILREEPDPEDPR